MDLVGWPWLGLALGGLGSHGLVWGWGGLAGLPGVAGLRGNVCLETGRGMRGSVCLETGCLSRDALELTCMLGGCRRS